MITLSWAREIAGCNVRGDDLDPLAWSITPQSPQVALDPAGIPIFSLAWYRRPVDQLTEEERKTRLGGGLLTFSAQLTWTEEQEKEIREAIAADPAVHQRLERDNPGGPDYRRWWHQEARRDPAALAEALKLSTLPVIDGTVTVAVLGEDPEHMTDFLANVVGVGGVSMTGNQRASFMAKLTQDGVVMLWEMIERNLPAIRVAYDLKYNHRLTGVKMVVWCDAKKAYDAIHEQWAHVNDNASWSVTRNDGGTHYRFSHDKSTDAGSRLQVVATNSETARVEIIPEAGADVVKPEQIAELTQIGNDMIKDFLAATFLEFKAGEGFEPGAEPDLATALAVQDGKPYGHHGIEYYNLKDWNEEMTATLDYQFKSQAVMQGSVAPNDNLANILAGHDVESLRTQIEIDPDWYRYLDVQVVCTADFDEDPVDLVKAHLSYHASGSQGRIDEEKDLVFQMGTPPQRFSCYLADPQQTTYNFAYEVFYKGSSQSFEVTGKSNDTIFVLDTDRMGVLRVDVQMGLVNWERIQSAFVKMWYGTGAERKETEFILDQARQSQRWVEVIARPVTDPYGYQVTFVDKEGQRIVLDPETSRSKTLVVNQPLEEALEIVLVPAGSFGAGGLLSQVVVAVRYKDDDNDYHVDEVFTLVKEGESKTWEVPLINKDLRTYEYRVSVFYSDGVTREDAWQTTDKTVLPVGDPFGWRVQILPYLLKNPPGRYQFGTIHLEFDDPAAGIHAEKDFQITDFATPLVWRFRLGSPEEHTYRYQLTLYEADGRELPQPEAEESKEVLVLVPPAQP
jgi:hypothetical protein